MKKIQFLCTLLSDIIIKQNAATEGYQAGLDFIPGSSFLGIVAGNIYDQLKEEEQILIFHSGKVRFGDAHPVIMQNEKYKRALRIPACMFYPKLKSPFEKCYIHHKISSPGKLKEEQLKQCRDGFYFFSSKDGIKAEIDQTFSLKSAYDRDKRRSEDQQMYGYQSIVKGLKYAFEIYYDDDIEDHLIEKIEKSLEGKKRVGRSRTAQYGLVEIKPLAGIQEMESIEDKEEICIYAEGRLIFLDAYGLPTFKPTAEQLGFPGATVLWEKSQLRTFQYAPWNFKRQARDTDRCGLEKGSVLILKRNGVKWEGKERFVGVYQNEGFGKILINPAFLAAKENKNGEAYVMLQKENSEESIDCNEDELTGNPVLTYLFRYKNKVETEAEVYRKVNEFIDRYGTIYQKDSFSSQWGKIRAITTYCRNKEMIREQLFSPDNGYLKHGVAKEKWQKGNRIQRLEEFFNTLSEEKARLAMINLAVEMAKKCNK